MGLKDELNGIDPEVLAQVAVTMTESFAAPDGINLVERMSDYPGVVLALGRISEVFDDVGLPKEKALALLGGFVLLTQYIDVMEQREQFGVE